MREKTVIRKLESPKDYTAFENLQRETWGQNLSEVISGSMASIVQKIGGVAAGAFAEDGELQGIIFGFTGYKGGRVVHWSHMLAVKEKVRNAGIGKQLKLFQREVLLEMGVTEAYWTYDPLVAKNASFNFNILGARATEYVVDMYGPGDDCELFRGLGTDRFILSWDIAAESVAAALEGKRTDLNVSFLDAPTVLCMPDVHSAHLFPVLNPFVNDSRVKIEIPPDIHALRQVSPAGAMAWRERTREAFQFYLSAGYEVAGFTVEQSGRCWYCMRKER